MINCVQYGSQLGQLRELMFTAQLFLGGPRQLMRFLTRVRFVRRLEPGTGPGAGLQTHLWIQDVPKRRSMGNRSKRD